MNFNDLSLGNFASFEQQNSKLQKDILFIFLLVKKKSKIKKHSWGKNIEDHLQTHFGCIIIINICTAWLQMHINSKNVCSFSFKEVVTVENAIQSHTASCYWLTARNSVALIELKWSLFVAKIKSSEVNLTNIVTSHDDFSATFIFGFCNSVQNRAALTVSLLLLLTVVESLTLEILPPILL